MPPRRIILASSSPYRRRLLERLGLDFESAAPRLDERPRPGESTAALVQRLARAKAEALAARHPEALIIGADQAVVGPGGVPLGKPGTPEANVRQLREASGRRVELLTGVCLLDARSGRLQCERVPFAVVFRELSTAQIESYVRREKPWDCAGGFRAEGLGIALFQRLEGDDPTALVGLPLICLARMLGHAGIDVLLES